MDKMVHASRPHQLHFLIATVAFIYFLATMGGLMGNSGGECGTVPVCIFNINPNADAVGPDAAAYLEMVNERVNAQLFSMALIGTTATGTWMVLALYMARKDKQAREAAITGGQ